MSRRVFVWMFAWLLMVGAAGAQQGTSEVRGRVLDATGASLPGVTVTVKNQNTGMFRETLSGDNGAFIASALVPGRYEVSAALQGFKTFKRGDLQLEVGRTATIDVTMEVGGMEETLTVTAGTPLVDVTSKEIGGNITTETLVQLPSVNGNFIGFIGLLPGIVPSISTESFGSDSISVNGQDPRNNNYTVDGGNNNDDVIGQRAGMQARTPIEAVQEFQVLTGQYDAEFGRTTGAVVNAVIKSGTNVIHGSAFGFFQDSSMTSKDFLAKQRDLAKADTSYQRWGGVIGGPILKDRMHYFASVERFAIDRANTIVFPTRPDLNDQQTTKDRVWNTIVRGDHQVSQQHTYNVRWLREQSPQLNQIVPNGTRLPDRPRRPRGIGRRPDAGDEPQLGAVQHQGEHPARHLDARERHLRERVLHRERPRPDPVRSDARLPELHDQQDNTGQFRINDGIAVDDTIAWFLPGKRGDHDIKVGLQYVYSGAQNENSGNLNGTFAFGQNDLDFDPANPRTYPDRFTIRVGGASRFYQKATYFSTFAQDKWRMTPRLTLSLGLRYDLEVIPLAETDNPLVESYPVDKNNFQPRLGVTYDLGGGQERRARRLRPLLREDALRADRRPLHRHALHQLVRGQFPDGRGGRRAAQRPAADRPVPGERPVRQPDAARSAVPAGTGAAQHRRELGQRGSRRALHRRVHPRLRAPARREPGGERRLRAVRRPRPADVDGPESGAAGDDGSDVTAGAAGERDAGRGLRGAAHDLSRLRQFHHRGDAAGERRQDRLRRAARQRQQALRPQLRNARLVHASRSRAATRRATASPPAASRCSTT